MIDTDEDDLPSPPPVLWHTPVHSPKNGTLINTTKQSISKYTTSLASLPTPTNAIRVTSVKRVPYSPRTLPPSLEHGSLYTNAMNTPKRTFKHRRCRTSFEPHATSTPVPSLSKMSELDESLVSYETTQEYISGFNFQKRLARLRAKIDTEFERVHDAKRMIIMMKKTPGQRYSMRELCAHALLVISRSRLNMYKDLYSRVETYMQLDSGPPPTSKFVRSRITIKHIELQLTRSYYLKTIRDDAPNAFMVLVSTYDKCIASEVLLSNETDGRRDDTIEVKDHMTFLNLPLNFHVRIEIFAMRLDKKAVSSPKEIAKKAMSIFGNCTSPYSLEEIEKTNTGFHSVGYAYITRDNAILAGSRRLLITDNLFPIDGLLNVNFECTPLPPELFIIHKGNWSLFCGTGDCFYWVKMINGLIRFYDFHQRDEDPAEEPRFVIDMSYICNRKIEAGEKRDGKFSFTIDVLSFPRDSEYCDIKRYSVGFETEHQLNYWIEAINQCLDVIRSNN